MHKSLCVCPDGECVEHCKEGFFVDEESQECEPCHSACRTCGGPRSDDCDSCEEGFTLKNGECLEGEQWSAPCPEKSFRNSTANVKYLNSSICSTSEPCLYLYSSSLPSHSLPHLAIKQSIFFSKNV